MSDVTIPIEFDAEKLLAERQWLTGFVRALVRDEATADDLVQDAFAAALEQRPPVERARAWLATVVRRRVGRTRDSEARRRARERAVASDEAIPSASDLVARASLQHEVAEAVLALGEPTRSTVLLRFWHDLPPRAIAAHLDVPVETVRTRIKRGLAEVREGLDREHDGRAAWAAPLVTALPRSARLAPTLLAMSAATKKVLAGLAVAAAVVLGAVFAAGGTDAPSPVESPPLVTEVTAGAGERELDARPERALREPRAVDEPSVTPNLVVRGVVLEDESRHPIENARLHLALDGALLPGASTVTDIAGRFELRAHAARGLPALVVTADGHAPVQRGLPHPARWQDGVAHVDLDPIALPIGTGITGIVVSADGAPVVGARLLFVEWTNARVSGNRGPSAMLGELVELGHTDGEGRFAPSRRLVPAPHTQTLFAFSTEGIGWSDVRTSRRASEADVLVRLAEPCELVVVVTDEADRPLPGAWVEVRPTFAPAFLLGPGSRGAIEEDAWLGVLVARADDAGVATLRGLPAGRDGPATFEVVATAAGHRRHTLDEVQLTPDAPARVSVALAAVPVCTVEARVVDTLGTPIEGALVTANRASGSSDVNGVCRLTDVEPSWAMDHPFVVVEAEAPGHRGDLARHLMTEAAGTFEVELVLEPARTVRGIVCDGAGDPVRGAFVTLREPGPGGEAIGGAATTNLDGTFAITTVPRRDVVLRVKPPSGRSFAGEVRVPVAAHEEKVTVVLERADATFTTLQVEVVDASDGGRSELSHAFLTQVDADGFPVGTRREPRRELGGVVAEGLTTGHWRLQLTTVDGRRAQRIFVVEPDTTRVEDTIRVGSPGRIVGRVDLSGTVAPPDRIELVTDPHDAGRWSDREDRGGRLTLDTGSPLEFVLEDVVPDVPVTVRIASGGMLGEASVTVGSGEESALVVSPGETGAVSFRASKPCPSGTVAIRVRQDGGEWQELVKRFGTRGDVELSTIHLPPGQWQWSVLAPPIGIGLDGRQHSANGTVEVEHAMRHEVIVRFD